MDIEGVLDVVKDGFIETRFTFSSFPKNVRTYKLQSPILDVLKSEDNLTIKCPMNKPFTQMNEYSTYTVNLKATLTIDYETFYIKQLNKYNALRLVGVLSEERLQFAKSDNYKIKLVVKINSKKFKLFFLCFFLELFF